MKDFVKLLPEAMVAAMGLYMLSALVLIIKLLLQGRKDKSTEPLALGYTPGIK